MVQQGIYATPCEVKPNRDRADLASREQRLWVIEFKVNSTGGCAMVKAKNPKEAEQILKSEGIYNGTPYLYRIGKIEEIIPSPDSMLLAENIVDL